tara:strand:- start:7330 stop:7635 length:306 start_codon:yes stop_codon:yes gene_type:complete
MFDKIKIDDVIALKFSTGEEVLATFKKEEPNSISIIKGLVLMQGPQGIALGTFFSTADPEKEIALNKDLILSAAELNPKLKDQYSNVFSKIKTQPKPSIIT